MNNKLGNKSRRGEQGTRTGDQGGMAGCEESHKTHTFRNPQNKSRCLRG